jgi:hypothetical protein
MKLLTQFFLANTRIIIDQHHEEGMGCTPHITFRTWENDD